MRSLGHVLRATMRFAAGATVMCVAIVASVALIAASGASLVDAIDVDGVEKISFDALAQRSAIYAADGSVLANLYAEDRIEVALDGIPPTVRDAVIAVEDDGFYRHKGVSMPAVARALKANAQAGAVAEGGSTITQQLVKNELLTRERTMSRKVREVVLARRVEQEYSKPEILERYLNTVYFGEGAHGVYTAAQRYFAKRLDTLTLGEAALLAGQIASPSAYNPFTDPEAAKSRRRHVLTRMVQEGDITPAEAQRAGTEPLPTQRNHVAAQPRDYFAEEVRRRLLEDPRLGATRSRRRDKVFRGGLKVYTTLDPRLQSAAEQAVRDGLPESPFTAALVAVSPLDGAVLAVVGGRGFWQAKFNLATQGARQPGSSFKPIALAAALEPGLATEDLVNAQAPCEFPMPAGQAPWKVLNYDGDAGGGVMTLREATVKSSNCAYAHLRDRRRTTCAAVRSRLAPEAA